MLKQYTLAAGCGLALILTACTPPAAEQTPAETTQVEQVKPESSETQARENRPRQNANGARRAPPEIAYAACEGLAADAACSFETPRGTRAGTCRTRPGDERALCAVPRPSGERPPRPRPARE